MKSLRLFTETASKTILYLFNYFFFYFEPIKAFPSQERSCTKMKLVKIAAEDKIYFAYFNIINEIQ